MEIIKLKDVVIGKNSNICKTIEYSFQDKDLDLGVATITGRFPEKGYVYNTISKELIYILEGTATIHFENNTTKLNKGDAILIEPNELYYWDTSYCVASMFCTPAWDPSQHKLIIKD